MEISTKKRFGTIAMLDIALIQNERQVCMGNADVLHIGKTRYFYQCELRVYLEKNIN